MRILLLNDVTHATGKGGDIPLVEMLRHGFRVVGHSVTLITTHRDLSAGSVIRRQDANGQIVSLWSDYPRSQRHRRVIRNPALRDALRREICEALPDVVHAHIIHQHLSYESLLFGHEAGARTLLTAHDTYPVSFGRVGGPDFERASIAGRPYRMRLWEHLSAAGRAYWPLRNACIRSILHRADTTVVPVSASLGRFLNDNGIGRTHVIYNATVAPPTPTADAVIAFRREHDLTGPTILFGGRISVDKGIEIALQVLTMIIKRIPDAQLLIVADADKAASYLVHSSPSLRASIRLAGWLTADQMTLAYAATNIVIVPSVYLDASPMINLEAMASFRPVVGTCFGGTPESIIDGETGFIRDPRNVGSFADACIALLEDAMLAKRFGEAGGRRVAEKFSAERFQQDHLRLYGCV